MKLENYDSIIFDLGGVILNLSYHKTVEKFQKLVPNFDEETFLGKKKQLPFYSAYEVGKLSTEEFKKSFQAHYKIKIVDSVFEDFWNAMLIDFPVHKLDLIKSLKKEKQVFLLSNINQMHERAVDELFSRLNYGVEFRNLFNKIYYSHHVGLRKPDAEIFELVVSENKLNKERTLFIDDSEQHITGAKSVGLDSILLQRNQNLEDLELFSSIF